MLAMADRKGRVYASIPGLANTARVTIEECEQALARFMSPDKYSRTNDYDGKRIEPIDGGWHLLNYAKYREMRDAEDRAAYQREWVRAKRQHPKVDNVDRIRPQSTQAEVEEETEKTKAKTKTGRAFALPDWLPEEPWKAWLEVRQRIKAPNTERALKLAIGDLERLRAQGHEPGGVLDNATKRGWRGLYAPQVSTGTVPDYSGVAANIKD